MVKEIIITAKDHMQKSIAHTNREFASLRTGRASTELLKHITVDYYGVATPLEQVAKVTVPEARLLVVQPWEKRIISDIEKAILEANLGLNPTNNGEIIRVPIPELTSERRGELAKLAHKMAEEGRIAIRNVRKDANNKIKAIEKNRDISQDEASVAYDDMQNLTNDSIKKIDDLIKEKEKSILED